MSEDRNPNNFGASIELIAFEADVLHLKSLDGVRDVNTPITIIISVLRIVRVDRFRKLNMEYLTSSRKGE